MLRNVARILIWSIGSIVAYRDQTQSLPTMTEVWLSSTNLALYVFDCGKLLDTLAMVFCMGGWIRLEEFYMCSQFYFFAG